MDEATSFHQEVLATVTESLVMHNGSDPPCLTCDFKPSASLPERLKLPGPGSAFSRPRCVVSSAPSHYHTRSKSLHKRVRSRKSGGAAQSCCTCKVLSGCTCLQPLVPTRASQRLKEIRKTWSTKRGAGRPKKRLNLKGVKSRALAHRLAAHSRRSESLQRSPGKVLKRSSKVLQGLSVKQDITTLEDADASPSTCSEPKLRVRQYMRGVDTPWMEANCVAAVVERGGVSIRHSEIPNAGMGLFAGRFFRKNELITEYEGDLIDFATAQYRRKQGLHTHIRCVEALRLYIDGVKDQKACRKRGGASFANDARNQARNNSAFVTVYDRSAARYRVYLKALRDITIQEEIYVSYGRGYWQSFGLA